MSTSSRLAFNSVLALEQQQRLIDADIILQQQQLERLRTLGVSLSEEEMKMNQATLKAQQLLSKAPFHHPLQQPQTGAPLEKMQLLMQQAAYVKTQQAFLDREKTFEQLNAAVGKTNALAGILEDQVDELDRLLLAFGSLVEEGEKTLKLSQPISKEKR